MNAERELRRIASDLRPVLWAINMTEVAERVIADLGDAPGRFLLLRPTLVLGGKIASVYEHHAREIVVRHMTKKDTRLGTCAEVLCGLLGAATVHPLNSQGMALAASLSKSVLGFDMGIAERERYAGELDEQLAFSRRKLAQGWRTTT